MQRIANPSTPVRFRPQYHLIPHETIWNKKSDYLILRLMPRMLPQLKNPERTLPIYNKPLIQLVIEEVVMLVFWNYIRHKKRKRAMKITLINFELEQKVKSSKNIQKLKAIKYPIDENLKYRPLGKINSWIRSWF